MLSCVARIFITLNHILAPLLHFYRAFFVSSKIKEEDILHALFIWQKLTLFLCALHLIKFGRPDSSFRAT